MTGYGVPVTVVPHCKPQRASHPAFAASTVTLQDMGVQVLYDPNERRLPSKADVVAALPAPARRASPAPAPRGLASDIIIQLDGPTLACLFRVVTPSRISFQHLGLMPAVDRRVLRLVCRMQLDR